MVVQAPNPRRYQQLGQADAAPLAMRNGRGESPILFSAIFSKTSLAGLAGEHVTDVSYSHVDDGSNWLPR